jgi:hypothetical protein
MHLGHMIRAEFDKQPKSHTIKWFAEQLCCDRRNIYDIFSRSNIDVELLCRISAILNHDFFCDLSLSMHNRKLLGDGAEAGNNEQM